MTRPWLTWVRLLIAALCSVLFISGWVCAAATPAEFSHRLTNSIKACNASGMCPSGGAVEEVDVDGDVDVDMEVKLYVVGGRGCMCAEGRTGTQVRRLHLCVWTRDRLIGIVV